MLTDEKRAQAYAAITAAQPQWAHFDVLMAIERMPTESCYGCEPGSLARLQCIAAHKQALADWLQYVLTPGAARFVPTWETYVGTGIKAVSTPPHGATGDGTAAPITQGVVKAGSKKALVHELMKRSEGVSVDEIMRECGVASSSAATALISDVKRMGVQFTKKEGRYYVS